ncbi:uncharacterized protein FIBRA_03373 [Fibroporia radiculosa]|uniref:RNA polymerase III subunit Rpc25 domain-containing protein n=1 Tax=Fibroporia radiculosa TaxID=599839 RepID=J4H2D3_9APHY|nr:uncharacterized protein FIBRA_03373 [Fibroporia radiculosa]CCM01324.1 predicted protein [Fibroporia radiculosa]
MSDYASVCSTCPRLGRGKLDMGTASFGTKASAQLDCRNVKGHNNLNAAVIFRLTVFRPFPSEVILAKVKSSDEDGIRLTVGFFDDVYVPLIYLPEPSAFDPNERAHFWLPGAEGKSSHELLDSATADRMYVDTGEVVRVRVEADEFYDDEPGPPKATEGVQQAQAEGRRPPYTITCSIAEQGLGPITWWKNAGVEMDEG